MLRWKGGANWGHPATVSGERCKHVSVNLEVSLCEGSGAKHQPRRIPEIVDASDFASLFASQCIASSMILWSHDVLAGFEIFRPTTTLSMYPWEISAPPTLGWPSYLVSICNPVPFLGMVDFVEGMSVVGCCCDCIVAGFFEVNYDSATSARSKFGALEKSFFLGVVLI